MFPRPLPMKSSMLAAAALLVAIVATTVSAVTQYHEQGLRGQDSYKYGFDTGDYSNPQQRHEERDGLGNVKGHFTYMDGSGHKIVVYYKADKNGFYRSDDPSNGKSKGPAAAASSHSAGGHYAAGSKHHQAKTHPHHHHHHHHNHHNHHKHHSHLTPQHIASDEAPVMTPVASDISASVNAHPTIGSAPPASPTSSSPSSSSPSAPAIAAATLLGKLSRSTPSTSRQMVKRIGYRNLPPVNRHTP